MSKKETVRRTALFEISGISAEPIPPGTDFDCPANEVAYLERVGAVAMPEDGSGDPPPEQRQQEVNAVVAGLDPDDASLWTKSGAPRADAVNERVGFDTTPAERTTALELLNA